MTPSRLNVRVGDEIRWINRRSEPVTLEFVEDALDDVVCQEGFTNFFERRQDSVSIAPNESVSLCFGSPGEVNYNARMDSPVAGGEVIKSGGSIRIR